MWLKTIRESFDSVTFSDLVAFVVGSGFGYFLARAWWG